MTAANSAETARASTAIESREMCSLHILDYLSWLLHPGWTITQALGNPALAYCVAMLIAKPRNLYTGP